MKTVIIFGAGASYAESLNNSGVPFNNKPPLDADFLKKINERAFSDSRTEVFFKNVDTYLKEKYHIDVVRNNYSLEYIYNIIYHDAREESIDCSTINHILNSLTIMIRYVIAHTTNIVNCDNDNGIFGLLKLFVKDYPQNRLDIVTFNYDLIVERSLDLLQGDAVESNYFNIQKCYPTKFKGKLTNTQLVREPFKTYDLGNSITIDKLHGSLNWYLRLEPNQHVNEPIKDSQDFYLIEDKLIFSDIEFYDEVDKKKFILRPMIIPPTFEKNRFYRNKLTPSWASAESKLSHAERIVVFGYSLPEADLKAQNMFLRALAQNKNNPIFEVIDTNPHVCQRYMDKLPIGSLRFYKSVEDYKNQN